ITLLLARDSEYSRGAALQLHARDEREVPHDWPDFVRSHNDRPVGERSAVREVNARLDGAAGVVVEEEDRAVGTLTGRNAKPGAGRGALVLLRGVLAVLQDRAEAAGEERRLL